METNVIDPGLAVEDEVRLVDGSHDCRGPLDGKDGVGLHAASQLLSKAPIV